MNCKKGLLLIIIMLSLFFINKKVNALNATLYGDINVDETVNRQDLLKLEKYFLDNSTEITEQGFVNADVNKDGVLDTSDLYIIENYCANVVTSLPVKIGDLNNDNDITSLDQEIIDRHISGDTLLTGNKLFLADLNMDGNIDDNDITILTSYLRDFSGNPLLPIKTNVINDGNHTINIKNIYLKSESSDNNTGKVLYHRLGWESTPSYENSTENGYSTRALDLNLKFNNQEIKNIINKYKKTDGTFNATIQLTYTTNLVSPYLALWTYGVENIETLVSDTMGAGTTSPPQTITANYTNEISTTLLYLENKSNEIIIKNSKTEVEENGGSITETTFNGVAILLFNESSATTISNTDTLYLYFIANEIDLKIPNSAIKTSVSETSKTINNTVSESNSVKNPQTSIEENNILLYAVTISIIGGLYYLKRKSKFIKI